MKECSDDYLNIALFYPSDNKEQADCLRQTLHCLLRYVMFHILHLTLSCILSYVLRREKKTYIILRSTPSSQSEAVSFYGKSKGK